MALSVTLCALFGYWLESRTYLLVDTTWLLSAGERWIDGAVLYRDVWETNPPLVVWLHAGVVQVARTLDVPWAPAFRVLVTLAGFLSLSLLARLRESDSELVVAAAVIFVLPGPFFGQREHLILMGAIPWLAILRRRMAGGPVSVPLAVSAALLMAIGIALKPPYVLLWALPFLFLGTRAFRLPEVQVIPLVGLIYLGLVLQTEYLVLAGEWADLYWEFRHRDLVTVALLHPLALMTVVLLGLSIRSRLLVFASLACYLAVLVQGKGFTYHYFPAVALAILAALTASRWSRIAVTIVLLVWGFGLATQSGKEELAKAAELNAAIGPAEAIVLSPIADWSRLLVSEHGRPWALRHSGLWWLEIAERAPADDERLRRTVLPDTLPPVIATTAATWAYLTVDPAIAASLRAYQVIDTIHGYLVMRHD